MHALLLIDSYACGFAGIRDLLIQSLHRGSQISRAWSNPLVSAGCRDLQQLCQIRLRVRVERSIAVFPKSIFQMTDFI